jgi:hypothetical protein
MPVLFVCFSFDAFTWERPFKISSINDYSVIQPSPSVEKKLKIWPRQKPLVKMRFELAFLLSTEKLIFVLIRPSVA